MVNAVNDTVHPVAICPVRQHFLLMALALEPGLMVHLSRRFVLRKQVVISPRFKAICSEISDR